MKWKFLLNILKEKETVKGLAGLGDLYVSSEAVEMQKWGLTLVKD